MTRMTACGLDDEVGARIGDGSVENGGMKLYDVDHNANYAPRSSQEHKNMKEQTFLVHLYFVLTTPYREFYHSTLYDSSLKSKSSLEYWYMLFNMKVK